jgi:hypothetical protein
MNNMVISPYSIIANRTSKNLLREHVARNPCDWQPSLSCRRGIKLNVPEYQHGSVKWMPPEVNFDLKAY